MIALSGGVCCLIYMQEGAVHVRSVPPETLSIKSDNNLITASLMNLSL